MADITLAAAFLAGFASFLSPCVLPLIPAFLAYLGGVSLKDLGKAGGTRLKIFLNTLAFVMGFVSVFSVFGLAINELLGGFSFGATRLVEMAGGTVIVILGLFTLGLVRIGPLEREYKLKPVQTRYAYLTSFIFGSTFAVSWTPCVGAILGSVFALAAISPADSLVLLIAYSCGLAIPFLLTGAFTAQAGGLIAKHGRFLGYFNKAMGFVLVVIGMLVFTGQFTRLSDLAFAGRLLGGSCGAS